MQKKLLSYLFYAWLIVLIVFNVIPNLNEKINEVNIKFEFRVDYVFHFLFYFTGILLFWFWKFEQFYRERKGLILLFLLLWLFISSINEYCQHYIPGRSYNIIDLLMNVSGVFLASLVSFILFSLKLRKIPADK
ncbi:MAG: VanZ family protein [Bacteroidales bacterium]|nr:VanZ family protein [Bacteroidales bacterium]